MRGVTKDSRGKEVELCTYKGKVLLVVNVASKCQRYIIEEEGQRPKQGTKRAPDNKQKANCRRRAKTTAT
ncbi:hypothetical protein QYF36_007102 [Acer negundo]|nr:hypothetical protein QYF36_007102 [Acer negundo]